MMTVGRLLAWVTAVTLFLGVVAPQSASSETLTLQLVPRGSVWRYLDTGTNLGSSWVTPGFNDSLWLSGPARLGYGGDTEATTISFGPNAAAKYITTYFRRTFDVAD